MGRLKIFETTTQNFINFAGGNPGAITTLFELQKVAQDKIDIDERVKNVGYGKSFDDLIQDKKERKEE